MPFQTIQINENSEYNLKIIIIYGRYNEYK